jgi:hypothetical protein
MFFKTIFCCPEVAQQRKTKPKTPKNNSYSTFSFPEKDMASVH